MIRLASNPAINNQNSPMILPPIPNDKARKPINTMMIERMIFLIDPIFFSYSPPIAPNRFLNYNAIFMPQTIVIITAF